MFPPQTTTYSRSNKELLQLKPPTLLSSFTCSYRGVGGVDSLPAHDVHIYRNNDFGMLDNTMTMLMVDTASSSCLLHHLHIPPTTDTRSSPGSYALPWPEHLRTNKNILRWQNFYDANKQTKNTGFHFMATTSSATTSLMDPRLSVSASCIVYHTLTTVTWFQWVAYRDGDGNGKFITSRADKYERHHHIHPLTTSQRGDPPVGHWW